MKPNRLISAKGWWPCLMLLALLFTSTARGAEQLPPLPEMVVPKTTTPPTIDGKMTPGEWDRAVATTGFIRVGESKLAHVQSIVWMTYDDQYFYVCIKNLRGEKQTLITKKGRRPDDGNIVYDYSNEIWLTPPVAPATTYQTLFNSYPGVFDTKLIPSLGYNAMAWSARWQIAASETKDYWMVEAKAPIKSFGVERVTDGAIWHALFTTDILDAKVDQDKFRAWAPGGGFADISRHGKITFKDNGPTFQLLDVASVFTGKISFPMAVLAPAKGNGQVDVTVRFGGMQAAAGDQVVKKAVSVADGKREEFTIAADVTGNGFCEVTAKAGDGNVLYHQVFPYVVDNFVRTQPSVILASPYSKPEECLTAFYAPLNKQLIVKVDRLYMDQRAAVQGGKARLLDPATGKVLAERSLAAFQYDYSEFPMDLSKVEVPVQSDADWLKARPVMDENAKLVKAGQPAKPLPGVNPVECLLEVTLADKDGKNLSQIKVPVKLMGYSFEWMDNNIGISDKVIPPWTPVKAEGGTISMWNRSYDLNGLGLAEKIVNAGAPQLSGAMKLVAVVDGKETQVPGGKATVKKLTEAGADLTGTTKLGDMDINVNTRVEFDGFVLNTMTLDPKKPTKIDRLSLLVTMPKAEGECMVTTSGWWASYHGWTPERWDSRETSSASRVGNFVPYIFLTDSERGFCWFADTDKGWICDPAAPTQEVARDADTVTLRVHFISKAGMLDKPTTIQYGWMTTPQKPQPKGWRGTVIDYRKPAPQATAIFWEDADRDTLWDYYCGPFPRNYDKSKQLLEGASHRGFTPAVGQIAHSIGRYKDYKGRWFTELAADWGAILGDDSNANVARSRGVNDFMLWHYDRWCKQASLTGLYFDESYLGEEMNYLTGGAYLLPDGTIQPGYSYLGLREFNKRIRYMFHANGKPTPNLWLHSTGGHPVYAWSPDVAMEAENVEPTSLENDYPEALPAGRLRAIGMGVNLGCAPFIMGQVNRHASAIPDHAALERQFVGWVLLHDCLPESSYANWNDLCAELEMWREDIRFVPYWKKGTGIQSADSDILVSAHVRPGQAVLWVFNMAREDRKASIQLDLKKLGLDPAKIAASDVQSKEKYTLQGNTLTVNVPKRMWHAIRLAN